MVRKAMVEAAEGLGNGVGKAEVHHIITKEEFLGHGRMYAKVVLKPHSTVGYHQHIGETEPYYILKGKGTFIDNDGGRIEVGAGDVCVIEVGHSHSLENNSEEDLEFMAMIYNEEVK